MADEGTAFARKVRVQEAGDDSSDNGERRPPMMAEVEVMLADVEYYTNRLIHQST